MPDEVANTTVVQETLASKGTISMSSVVAVLTQGVSSWIPIIKGSFELCEINFTDPSLPRPVGGVVGFRFRTEAEEGKIDCVYITLEVMAAVRIEEIQESE